MVALQASLLKGLEKVVFGAVFGFTLIVGCSQAFAVPAETITPRSRAVLLLREASRVASVEPQLYADSRFASLQEWTLKHQGFVSNEANFGDFKRLMFFNSTPAFFKQFARAWEAYATRASRLLPEVFSGIALHRSMITDLEHDRLYVATFNEALSSMLPLASGNPVAPFQVMDCDYVAQPTNALWFSLNAMIILDDQATLIFGDRWITERERIKQESGNLLEFSQFRTRISAGLPYTPAPHL